MAPPTDATGLPPRSQLSAIALCQCSCYVLVGPLALWQGGTAMRTLILALGFVAAALPVRAQTIPPAEIKAHVGQTVTVQAAVSDVHIGRAGVTFIDIGG